MMIDPWILAFSGLTVLATIWMGFWSARRSKTAHDFYVAGRSVSVGWNASAISGEYLSAASFMGVAGMVMSSGYDALWYPVCYACGYLFLLLFIAGPLRRFGAYTIPDFAEGRFDSPVFRKIAVVFVLFIGFFYTMPQMKGAGTTLAYIFPGLPYWAGVVLVGAVITLNVALGGMKGITLVQAFQYWAKMFAIAVPIFVLMAVYGHYGKQIGQNRNGNPAPAAPLALDPKILNSFHTVTNLGRFDSRKPGLNKLTQDFKRDVDLAKDRLALARDYRLPDWGRTANDLLLWYLGLLRETRGVKWHYLTGDLGLYSIAISIPNTGSFTSGEALEQCERCFATNGVHLVWRDDWLFALGPQTWPASDAVIQKFMPSSELRSLRAPLPAKAPTDSIWLSPFGPLTTKAVKSAVAVG
ncbi:MAG: hypothetical protein DME26_15880, partial [Verrucomicrobia bacterium]